jgi:hypothetical protein
LFGKRIVDEISSSVIEIEGIHRSWEEIAERTISLHLSKDFVSFFIPFFFGILFVEDAKLLVFEADASQTE